MEVVKFVKMHGMVRTPSYATKYSAGMDLYADEYRIIPPGLSAAIRTGIKVQVPQGTYGRIAGRSSISLQNLHVSGGVIDADYTGEIFIIMFNNNTVSDWVIERGRKIAQLILERICHPELKEVTHLLKSERGTGGFGSTDENRSLLGGTLPTPSQYGKCSYV